MELLQRLQVTWGPAEQWTRNGSMRNQQYPCVLRRTRKQSDRRAGKDAARR
jgi:hypothetical protein